MYRALVIIGISVLLFGCGNKNQPDPYQQLTAEQIYSKGKNNAKKGKFEQAIKDYEALEANYPYGEYTSQAQLGLIHAFHKQGETATALAVADRFIRMNPRHKNVDYAYYMKGVVNFDQNFSAAYKYFPINRSLRDPSIARQAFDDFNILIERFPNSEYAVDARQRMIKLKNQLAEHELSVAGHYFQKKAYLAAANRAGYVVNQFDQSTAVPEALSIMVKSYRNLGMVELANDSFELLKSNFPESEQLKTLTKG